MFTGIIEQLGRVEEISKQGGSAKLRISCPRLPEQLALGDSIAVNGVCLTVEAFSAGLLHFHTLAETLQRSNLRQLSRGSVVNLESALRFGAKLGGHLVSGHVDGLGRLLAVGRRQHDIELRVSRPASQQDFPMVPKGSVAINGVSLTVATLSSDAFTVCLIPHTWEQTNLHLLRTGDQVNLEADLIGKYVLSLSGAWTGAADTAAGIDLDTLARAGF